MCRDQMSEAVRLYARGLCTGSKQPVALTMTSCPRASTSETNANVGLTFSSQARTSVRGSDLPAI
jgi:hypothetical protein